MAPRRPKIADGVVFPVINGRRSTQNFGRACLGAALKPLDAQAAEKALKEKNWRWGYDKHFVKMVQLSCASNEAALKCAKAGLEYVHSKFEFVRGEKTTSLSEGMKSTN